MKGKTALALIEGGVFALLLCGLAPKSAAAQKWSAGSYGVAEYDTKKTFLLLAGISGGPAGLGIKPRIGVQAYELGFDAGTARTNVFVIKPFVGLTNNYNGGAVSGSVGYAFSNSNTKVVGGTALTSDNGKGVVLSGGWDYWGTGGPAGYQVLGSYNFGSSSLWTRGRATRRLGQTNTHVGAEVAYLNGDNYWAWQPGALVQFHSPSGSQLGLGAGMKFFQGGQNAVYFKIEGYAPLSK